MSSRFIRVIALPVVLLVGALLAYAPPVSAKKVQLRAITSLTPNFIYSILFKEFIAQTNASGKGVIKLNYLGGPEVIPQRKQAEALRSGVVDVQYGPTGYYVGLLPEGDALLGANVSPMEARKNGGYDLMRQAYAKKLNAYFLSWMPGTVSFHLFLTNEPTFDSQGMLDLKGTKIRVSGTYREFFKSLNGTPINMSVGEIHTGLERGLVKGAGWSNVGMLDYSWHKFIKYRVDPNFYQTSAITMVNLDSWNNLSSDAKQKLEAAAAAYEVEANDKIGAKIVAEEKKLKEGGMKVVTLTGKAREVYLTKAYAAIWGRFAAKEPEMAKKMRPFFQK